METADQQHVDLLIRGAEVIDGSGSPRFRSDIAISDDRIFALRESSGVQANSEIDASGKVVTPGFIDTHTHDDRALMANPLMEAKISQGVTTVVTGNCGISLAPLKIDCRPPPPLDLLGGAEGFYERFSAYLAALDQEPPAVNALCQVGHSTLRVNTMDQLDRAANAQEIAVMCQLLEQTLTDGAIGFITGLFYRPAHAAPTEEVIQLAAVLGDYSGIHSTHMRDEADHVLESLEETFTIGKKAGIPVIISHHKCSGQANHGRSVETLARIDQARAEQPLGLDVYPYIASSTVLDAERMRGATRVLITWSEAVPSAAGRDLADIATEMGCSRQEAVERLQPAGAIYFMMDENDVRRILAYPHAMIGSDGLPHDLKPHPRLWGTFPRVLGHYVREVGLFSLEEAVRKMTSLPATQFGLPNRGVIREGAYADLVILDPDTIEDRASFEQPTLPAAGISDVLVNGRVIWHDGHPTGNRPGRVVRRNELKKGAD
jgi:N-acyl-D-amino-acid deacylase